LPGFTISIDTTPRAKCRFALHHLSFDNALKSPLIAGVGRRGQAICVSNNLTLASGGLDMARHRAPPKYLKLQ
jgi:hypothetical protein